AGQAACLEPDLRSFRFLADRRGRVAAMFSSSAKKQVSVLEAKLALYERAFAEIGAVCGRGAEGDMEARILDTESFGELAPGLRSINRIFDLFDAFMRETSASLRYASEGRYYRPFLVRGMVG